MMFLRRHGRAVMDNPCSQATANGFTVTYYLNRAPLRLTVDEHGKCVLGLEWKNGDAWRMEIETYHSGRWEFRLKAAAHPRPWLERCRALAFHRLIAREPRGFNDTWPNLNSAPSTARTDEVLNLATAAHPRRRRCGI